MDLLTLLRMEHDLHPSRIPIAVNRRHYLGRNIENIYQKNQFYEIKCVQVHGILYDTEDSLTPFGQSFSARI